MVQGSIIIAIVLVVIGALLALCVGIALNMNKSDRQQISKSNDEGVKKRPILDIENLDMASLFE
ncbi:MAG: hypothetical protein ACI4HM_05685 [Ruminococcus sp.]